MTIEVEGPDGAVIEFPDDTPPETMKAALSKHYGAGNSSPKSQNGDIANLIQGGPVGYANTTQSQFLSGANEGLGNTLGLPVDLANSAIGVGLGAVNKIAGTNFKAAEKPFLGSEQIKEALAGVGAIGRPSRDKGKQFARRVGQGVGEVAPFAMTGGGSAAARTLVSGASSGVGGATAQQLFPDNPIAEALGALMGGLAPTAVESVATKINAAKEARKATPTTEALLDSASDLYTKAEQSGFTAQGGQTRGLHGSLRRIASDEGLVTPKTDEILDTMPKVKAVLKMTDEFAGEAMTPTQMQNVRKTLRNAAQSADAAEARVGSMMLQKYDDFVSGFAPEFKQARQFYHRAKKAQILEQARELAGARAGQFTGSGFENALRTEYRALDRKIIKGDLRGFTEAEKAAIRKVARGTTASNAARNVGRFAPNGPVSFGVTTGVPFAVGNAVGGPPVGVAAAASAAGVGYGGRALATRLGIDAADTAELLVRAGVQQQQIQALSQAQREALAAVLAAQLSEASNPPERP